MARYLEDFLSDSCNQVHVTCIGIIKIVKQTVTKYKVAGCGYIKYREGVTSSFNELFGVTSSVYQLNENTDKFCIVQCL